LTTQREAGPFIIVNYYNEFDPKTAAWLRQLIKNGAIPDGHVDERSITDVSPSDLKGYVQCHFFAGIGGWSLALQLAGWPSCLPVWTGSCPCQPFSKGGNSLGYNDPRDLWHSMHRLISFIRPQFVFGEQVERAIKFGWFDRLQADLAKDNYSSGGVVMGAHSKALPHPRQRLFWFAHTSGELDLGKKLPQERWSSSIPSIWQSEKIFQEGQGRVDELVARRIAERVSSYSEALSILDGIPGRMVGIRGAGNAIVPQVAAEFIRASVEVVNCVILP
jgi:DNA (cytosine-5)-methyltransferase 1